MARARMQEAGCSKLLTHSLLLLLLLQLLLLLLIFSSCSASQAPQIGNKKTGKHFTLKRLPHSLALAAHPASDNNNSENNNNNCNKRSFSKKQRQITVKWNAALAIEAVEILFLFFTLFFNKIIITMVSERAWLADALYAYFCADVRLLCEYIFINLLADWLGLYFIFL